MREIGHNPDQDNSRKDTEMEFKPYKTRGRFEVVNEGGYWNMIDDVDGMTIGTRTKADAEDAATFARQYVKKHGDIDLGSFPWNLDSPLQYDPLNDEYDAGRHLPERMAWAAANGKIEAN